MKTTTPSLAQIHELLDQVMSTPTSHDMLDLAMATAVSQRVVSEGEPVWLLFEGSPSGGKTTIVELLRQPGKAALPSPAVFCEQVTYASLTQGFRDPKSGKRAPALLSTLNDRCWVNPEFSTLLAGRAETVRPILGVLTRAFDGRLSTAFGNVTDQDSPILVQVSRFSLLGCLTPAVRQKHSELLSTLGPRFLWSCPGFVDGALLAFSPLAQMPATLGDGCGKA